MPWVSDKPEAREVRSAHLRATSALSRLITIAAPVAVLMSVAAPCAMFTDPLGWRPTDPPGALAQANCQKAVRDDLVAPTTARFSALRASKDPLAEDDRMWLRSDARRVRSVWAVYGDAESQTRSDATAHAEFACRAVFVDDNSERTLVHYRRADAMGWLR